MFHLDIGYIGQWWPAFMWSVTLVSAIGCCMGFKEFVWFMSVGYGFSVMCIGAYLLIFGIIHSSLTVATALLSILFIIYGYRLGGYILKRELTSKDYKKKMAGGSAFKRQPVALSATMWICVAFLYAGQTSAVSYRMINQCKDNLFAYIGILIMILAILGESVADHQKSAAKKVNPHRFVDTGLYKYCRCPNYFSEIMFWVGVCVSGIGSTTGKQWIIVLISLVCIIYVMYNSAQRLELRHEKTYGLDQEYQKYSDTVPLLFPFTKMYHSMKVYRD